VGLAFACLSLALTACNLITGASDLISSDSLDPDGSSSTPELDAAGNMNVVADGSAGVDARGTDSSTNTDSGTDGRVDAATDAGADSGLGCQGAANCERIIFATSTDYDGNLGGIPGADAKCQARADVSTNARIKGRSFVAWISTLASSASARLTHGTMPYVRPDGMMVASDWTALVKGTIDNAILFDELGGSSPNGRAWTGTNSNGGGYSSYACTSWTNTSPTLPGVAGNVGGNGSGWSSDGLDACSSTHRLYCVER
jgi:hypothetical protein